MSENRQNVLCAASGFILFILSAIIPGVIGDFVAAFSGSIFGLGLYNIWIND